MIRLDFENPICLAAMAVNCGRGAQQALTESCEGDERWTEEQIFGDDLKKAFSGLSICLGKIGEIGEIEEIVQSTGGLVDDMVLGEGETSSTVAALWIFSSQCGSCIISQPIPLSVTA